MNTEDQVVEYLSSLRALEPDPREIARLRRPRKRARKALVLALAILAASSTLAAATGVIDFDERPMPPAKPATIPVPKAISAELAIFRRPAQPDGAKAFYNLRTAEIDTRSIHAVKGGHIGYGRTRDAADGVIVAADGIGFEGPFGLEDIAGGTAWGYTKRTLIAITADDVTRLDITYRDESKARFTPRDNVVIAHLEGPTPIDVRYVR